MASHIRTGEAWFGDSFDRNIVLGPGELNFTTAACSMDMDTLSKLTGYCNNDTYTITADCANGSDSTVYALAKGSSNENIVSITAVDTLSDRLDAIMAQVDALKQNFVPKKGAYELRSALKTLSYKREVE